MSDYLVKLVPEDPFCRIPEPLLQKSRAFLEAHVLCDSVAVKCSTTPVFVDCGGNLERILCPRCHSELPFGWWGQAMENASAFTSLETALPCCGNTVSLNDLDYQLPCRFACCVIEIQNPVCDLEDSVVDSIQTILGTDIRVIKAHL